MLLAIDIGNSNISVGLFDEKRDLKFLSSIDTDSRKTADQISIDLMNIFSLYRYDLRDVSGAIFSSVVPPINFMMAKALTRLLGKGAAPDRHRRGGWRDGGLLRGGIPCEAGLSARRTDGAVRI